MISARGVSLIYPDGTVALKNIDLEVSTGELICLIGPSGSGKTSLLKLLMGVLPPTVGELHVLGENLNETAKQNIRAIRRLMGPVFQDFKLMSGRTVWENVILGMQIIGTAPDKMKQDAAATLARVGLENKSSSLIENLSWGERQRVTIARAVVRSPRLILADEPTGNLDHDNAVNILELLSSFVDKETSVIITTHALHLINKKHTYRIFKLHQGEMIEYGRGCE